MSAALRDAEGVVRMESAASLEKIMEKVNKSNIALKKNVRTLVAFKKANNGKDVAADAEAAREAEARRLLNELLTELPVSQAARLAARITGQSRKELYEYALQAARESSPE